MKQLRVSHDANTDLEDIWTYIALRQGSEEPADRFIEYLTQRFPLLASAPGIGRRRENLRPGMRSFPVDNYVIYYRETDQHVVILRVVHAARTIRKLFSR